MDAQCPGLKSVLKSVSKNRLDPFDADARRKNTAFSAVLVDEAATTELWRAIKHYTIGNARTIVETMKEEDGFEAWREILKQCEPDLPVRKQAIMQELIVLGSKPCKDMAETRATVLKWDKLRAEVATLTGEALSEPHAMSVLKSFLDDQTRKFTQAYMNEKLDIFRQRVVGFLTNAGGISRDAMVIGSIGEKQKEENNDAVEEDWDEEQWGNGTAWAIKGGGKGTRRGPAGGCFNCGGDHYASECPNQAGKGGKYGSKGSIGGKGGKGGFGGKGDKGGVGGFQKGTKGDKGGYQKGGKGGKGGKAGGNGVKGPAGGCFECGGPHYASECPHMSRQASAYSLSNWWPGGAEDQLQVVHLAFIKGREMRKGAGRDTKVVTGNKFEILNVDKEDDDDEEIELDDEAVCDKDKEKSPQDCEAHSHTHCRPFQGPAAPEEQAEGDFWLWLSGLGRRLHRLPLRPGCREWGGQRGRVQGGRHEEEKGGWPSGNLCSQRTRGHWRSEGRGGLA